MLCISFLDPFCLIFFLLLALLLIFGKDLGSMENRSVRGQEQLNTPSSRRIARAKKRLKFMHERLADACPRAVRGLWAQEYADGPEACAARRV